MVVNLLATRVKQAKKELRDLKTACAHGLGSVSFYSATDEYEFTLMPPSMDDYLIVTVNIPAGYAYTPYCQCYISNAQYFQPISIKYNNNQVIFRFRSYLTNVTLSVYAKVICAVPIESLIISSGGPV